MCIRDSIERVEEPFVAASILVPTEFVGTIMELCQGRRADFVDMKYLSPQRVEMHYRLPLGEIVLDFFDQLKTRTRGYASLDYEFHGYRKSDLVKLDILLAGDSVDALSLIVPRERAHLRGKALVTKLRQKIPRQMFEVAVQAAIGSRVVARETVSYTHLRAHETRHDLVCRLLLEKKKNKVIKQAIIATSANIQLTTVSILWQR